MNPSDQSFEAFSTLTCPDCGQFAVCAKCAGDILALVKERRTGQLALAERRYYLSARLAAIRDAFTREFLSRVPRLSPEP